MKLAHYIKPMPNLMANAPYFRRCKGLVLIRTVYFQPEVYKDLLSEKPKHKNIGFLTHENIHYSRIEKVGILRFGLKYATRKGRFHEELVAYTAQMKYLKSVGVTFDIEICARALSGYLYWWCTSYETAKKELESAWKKA